MVFFGISHLNPFTSALVRDLVRRFNFAAINEVGLHWGLKKDLSALNRQIQGVLHDAKKKQTTQEGVEEWQDSQILEPENVLDEARRYDTKPGRQSRFHLTPNTACDEVGAGIVGEISNRETSSLRSKIYLRDEEKKII
ncbi:hypothetical protein Tco_0724640, partial [Tanacetum coccineum]